MSTKEEEERKEYVRREEPLTPERVYSPPSTVVRETLREPVTVSRPIVTTEPESEKRESVVRRTNTNLGAIVAMITGVVVLLFSIVLVFTKVFPYLSSPWSLLAFLIVAIILIAVGASLLQTKTSNF
jgi:hypothetical protein